MQRGRVLGEPQHGVQPPPARCCTSCPTTASPSRCRPPTSTRRRWPSWWPASAASRSTASTAPTTSACATQARAIIEQVRAGVGPALIHADVVRPYSHSAADTQSKYRSADELADEALARPDRPAGGRARRRRRAHARAGRRGAGRGQGAGGQGGGRGARRPAGPIRPRVTEQVYVLPAVPAPPATYEGGERGADRRGHQAHAARGDGGRRADPGVRRGRGRRPGGGAGQRRGQGRRVRHHARAAAGLRPGPLLQHAAVGGQHRRPGRRARRCGGCGRRPRSSSSTTSGRP